MVFRKIVTIKSFKTSEGERSKHGADDSEWEASSESVTKTRKPHRRKSDPVFLRDTFSLNDSKQLQCHPSVF